MSRRLSTPPNAPTGSKKAPISSALSLQVRNMAKASNEPLISVIVPFYNVENYFEKCLKSIIAQDYHNLEIILVDDGSEDKSNQIAQQYAKKDSRIKIIKKKNGGLSDARNTGIAQAHGSYICLIDSDDYVAKNYISVLYKLIIKYKVSLAATKHYIVYPKKTINTGTGEQKTLSAHDAFDQMLYDEDIDVSAWGKLYHKDLFANIQYPKSKNFEDTATTYKLFQKAKKIAINSVPTYYYIQRPQSITTQKFSKKMFELIEATDQMTTDIIKWYPDLQRGCARRKMFARLSTLSQLTKEKHPAPEYLQPLMQYIKENRRAILADPRIPRRDRLALHITKFGFRIYKLIWRTYIKNRGGVS